MAELTADQKFGVTDRAAKLAVDYNGGSPTGYTSALVDLSCAILTTCDQLDVIAAINAKINELVDSPRCATCEDDDPSDCETHGLCCDACHDTNPTQEV